jgi:curved DNA-binding protein CbpA
MKDNVNYVKQELNSEEKFLENSVKVERFFKKYKFLILGGLTLAIVLVIGYTLKTNMDAEAKLAANQAFEKVLKNPKDTASLNILKENNKKLYDVAMYINESKEGKVSSINVEYLKELSQYHKALADKNITELNILSMENKFLLKEFAIFNKALLLTNEGKYKEANASLALIQADSKAYELARLLKHHLASKE